MPAEIKSKLDLVEVIGESVALKKAGTIFKGLCPFHGEKTPSFVVTPARETWHCFGCGRGGDLFSFVMEREGIDFKEALHRLAPRAGVEIDERTSREDARRKRLHSVLEQAISFYHAVLVDSARGERALAYLVSRGFTRETIDEHRLGYAPDAWDTMSRTLIRKRNVREEELEQTGLATRRQRQGGGVYDRFRDRIIFPIRDASGNPTGLGGRVLPPDPGDPAGGSRDPGPKYVNTPASALFDKSRTLYLIDRAKSAIRRAGYAVIVEGNTDALMAHQQGFENVVGSLGTALTPGQIELVTRYAPRIALAYDVDAAGQSAATFGATELSLLIGEIERSAHKGRLTDVGVVRLPGGKDPDEVIRDTPEEWTRATEQPQPIMEYLIERSAARHDPRTIGGRQRLVDAVLPTLRQVTDPVRRDGYLQELSRRAGVDQRVLLEALRTPPTQVRGNQGGDGHRRIDLDAVLSTPGALDPEVAAKTLQPVEQALLLLLLRHPDEQVRLSETLVPEHLVTTPARELWRAILADRNGDPNGAFHRDRFLGALEPSLADLVRVLYARTDPLPSDPQDISQAADDCLRALRRQALDDALDFKRAELVEAQAGADEETLDRLQREVARLTAERAELDRERNERTLLSRFKHRTTTDHRTHTDPYPRPAGGF